MGNLNNWSKSVNPSWRVIKCNFLILPKSKNKIHIEYAGGMAEPHGVAKVT